MAGTPVDTRMGMDCVESVGLPGLFTPVSDDPMKQTAFQLFGQEEKYQTIRKLLEKAKLQYGCEKAFIYCNSLSGAVDFDEMARETGLSIVTPLHVYRRLAAQYKRLAVIAANTSGTNGIERTMRAANPDIQLITTGYLELVLAIEAGEAPEAIVERLHLADLADWYQACGAEALVLGCTHFPYIKEALAQRITLPLIDPAKEMLRLLAE